MNRAARRAAERNRRRAAKRAAIGGGAAVTFAASLVGQAPPAAADTFQVTTLDDTTDAGDGETTLREAIASANANPGPDVITFAPGLAGGDVLLEEGEIRITDDVEIVGIPDDPGTPGVDERIVVDAHGDSRVFYVGTGDESFVTVSIADLAILEGDAQFGGGIAAVVADLTLTRVAVSDNDADDWGGGIHLRGSEATLIDAVVSENEAGADGGGIYAFNSELTLQDTEVSGNTAGFNGGGVHVTYYDAPYGHVPAPGGGELRITGSAFLSNIASSGYGGGLAVSETVGAVVVEDTEIAGNDAGDSGGGASFFRVPDVTLSGVDVTGNTAIRAGGGLSLERTDGLVTLDDVHVEQNRAFGDPIDFPGLGAGIFLSDVRGGAVISGSTIVDNVAGYDDGFYAAAGRGGGIDVAEVYSDVEIVRTTIESNHAYGAGGGAAFEDIYATTDGAGSVTVEATTIAGNTAEGEGGGVYVNGLRYDDDGDEPIKTSVRFERSTISGNTSGTDGGGVYVGSIEPYSYVGFRNSTISSNTAEDDGGGLMLSEEAANAGIELTTITENIAEDQGGGVYVDNVNVVVDHSIVGINTANHVPDEDAGDEFGGEGMVFLSHSLVADVDNGGVSPGIDRTTWDDFLVGDPQLGPLGIDPDGGETAVHVPDDGSPVVNAGRDDVNVDEDQRGLPRPVGVFADLGAVELQNPPLHAADAAFAVSDAALDENDGSIEVTVVRTGDTTVSSAVRVRSFDGTASSPADFAPVDRVLEFDPGELSTTFSVSVVDDTLDETDETFTLRIVDADMSIVEPDELTITIVDDDDAPPPGGGGGGGPDDDGDDGDDDEDGDGVCSAELELPAGDVPTGHTHAASIACLYDLGLTSGTAEGEFEPEGLVSRAQMARFVANAMALVGFELPADPPDAFDDDDGSTHELPINQLAALGIVSGTGDRAFDPSASISRAQMAAFLVGAFEAVTGQELTATGDHFGDDDGIELEAVINAGFEAGLFLGTGEGTFDPASPVTRGQMATFLIRLVDALAEAGHPPAG